MKRTVIAGLVLLSVACGDMTRQGTSPAYLQVTNLDAASGAVPVMAGVGSLVSAVGPPVIVMTGAALSTVSDCDVLPGLPAGLAGGRGTEEGMGKREHRDRTKALCRELLCLRITDKP